MFIRKTQIILKRILKKIKNLIKLGLNLINNNLIKFQELIIKYRMMKLEEYINKKV